VTVDPPVARSETDHSGSGPVTETDADSVRLCPELEIRAIPHTNGRRTDEGILFAGKPG